MFSALCTGRPSQGENAAIASTRATILIGLLFPFLGRDRKKLRRYSRLLAGDIQAITELGSAVTALPGTWKLCRPNRFFGAAFFRSLPFFAKLWYLVRGTMSV